MDVHCEQRIFIALNQFACRRVPLFARMETCPFVLSKMQNGRVRSTGHPDIVSRPLKNRNFSLKKKTCLIFDRGMRNNIDFRRNFHKRLIGRFWPPKAFTFTKCTRRKKFSGVMQSWVKICAYIKIAIHIIQVS